MVIDRPLTKIYLNIRSWSFSELNSSVCVLQKYTLVVRRLHDSMILLHTYSTTRRPQIKMFRGNSKCIYLQLRQ